ncbi:hypothetical protein [Phormidesmis sp. 146-33]
MLCSASNARSTAVDIGTPDGAITFLRTPFPLKLSRFKYETTRRDLKYIGTVQLNSVSRPYGGKNSEFNGKFTEITTDGSYGCVGRFRIVDFPHVSRYTIVWFMDGSVKGKSCPFIGRTIEARELRVMGD